MDKALKIEIGHVRELARKICYLWERSEFCHKMGQAGHEKALREYSPERCYERLLTVYENAIRPRPGGNHKF